MGDEMTPGEVARTLVRIEKLLEPLVGLPVRMTNTEEDVRALTAKMDGVTSKTVFTAGLISGAGAVVNWIFGRH